MRRERYTLIHDVNVIQNDGWFEVECIAHKGIAGMTFTIQYDDYWNWLVRSDLHHNIDESGELVSKPLNMFGYLATADPKNHILLYINEHLSEYIAIDDRFNPERGNQGKD